MKPIIILGLGNSGSSAVVDYLRLRGDVLDPLDGQEFCLLQEKGGLISLERTISENFHHSEAIHALLEFERLSYKLGRATRKLSLKPQLGLGYSSRLRNYDHALEKFITGITACSAIRFGFSDKVNFTLLDWIAYKLGYMPISKNIVKRKPIPVTRSEFSNKARQLFKDLFEIPLACDFPDAQFYLLDQAGSFCAPVTSTRYLGEERRIIIVLRDPRDIFAERQRGMKSADEFIREYNSITAHIENRQWSDEKVLVLEFENFVKENKLWINRICDFVGLDPEVPSKYDPFFSEQNIGKWRKLIEGQDAKLISTKIRGIP